MQTWLDNEEQEQSLNGVRAGTLLASDVSPSPYIENISRLNPLRSPFFQLPPELRHRVYIFALADQWIHVEDYVLGGDAAFEVFTYKQSTLTKEEMWTYRQPPSGPQHNRNEGISLKFNRALVKQKAAPTCLARVCRQLHIEAALLPYRWSMFSFTNERVANHFTTSLVAAQQQQILKVSSSDTLRFGEWYETEIHNALSMPDMEESFVMLSTFSHCFLNGRYKYMTRGSLHLAERGHGIVAGTMTILETTTNRHAACCGIWYGIEDTIQSQGREIARVIYCFCTPEMNKRRESWCEINRAKAEALTRQDKRQPEHEVQKMSCVSYDGVAQLFYESH